MNPISNLVSIIIPTCNSARTIETCLKFVVAQSYRNLEVIIVDRFSLDRTLLIARAYGARVIQFDGWMTRARNRGIKDASGRFIMSVDSDMMLTSNVIAECVRLSELRGYDAIVIPEWNVGESYWAKCVALGRNLSFFKGGQGESARFFRRDVILGMGGYDENLEAGEDTDVQIRLLNDGYKVGRSTCPIVHQIGTITLRQVVSKQLRYGRTIRRFRAKHLEFLRAQRSALFLVLDNSAMLARDPIHTVGYFLIVLTSIVAQGSLQRLFRH